MRSTIFSGCQWNANLHAGNLPMEMACKLACHWQVASIPDLAEITTLDDPIVLLQVGSGTDPAEGAALAGAILDRLAGSARLTFATSHHAELKDGPVSAEPPSDIAGPCVCCC